MTKAILLALALLLSGTAQAQEERPAWIEERERMWELIEAECADGAPSFANLEDALKACRAARALGRQAGTIRIGDTEEYAELQLGRPERVERMLSQYGVRVWWFYPSVTVHFANGVVSTIHQN